ncbi:MAG: mismatch-specific DNA-glycosylase [bacterium]|nr:mismatch-specific DNA-glycosylase [bacterium]
MNHPDVLIDFIKPDLDLVFVGFNPSLRSAQRGHYYAGRNNQFWSFLYEAGFTDRLLKPEEDRLLLNYKIGVTDIVKGRATRGIGTLKGEEYRAGFEVLLGKLRIFRPRVVCFNGKSGYTRAMNQKCDYGLQRGTLAGAVLFLAPSSSGALPMPQAEKLAHYQDLKKRVDDIGARASAGMG